MSNIVKSINNFFRFAIKSEVDTVKEQSLLSKRQEDVFDMFYIKKQDIGFIADTLFCDKGTINKELKIIRSKLIKVLKL